MRKAWIWFNGFKEKTTPHIFLTGEGDCQKSVMLNKCRCSTINYIKVSGLIDWAAQKLDKDWKLDNKNQADKINKFQDKGNELREEFGGDILSQLVVQEITLNRHTTTYHENGQYSLKEAKASRQVAHIIDSLKHPEEWNLLKAIYGNMFYLVGVLCPPDTRKNRLIKHKRLKAHDATLIMERDKDEEIEHGQKLLKTLQHADFFIKNSRVNVETIIAPLKRFIDLLLGDKRLTPTLDEYAMYIAHSAQLRSGCLSRQVGAAIFSDDGTLLSTGRNDVPKSGGGLYSLEDTDNDNRCMHLYSNTCQNKVYKNRIFSDIQTILQDSNLNKEESTKVFDKIKDIDRLKGLIEFCRAVHAEMDAIISCARDGNKKLKGASLYCTTYPCHHCARHIVAAGIKKVYYIEPFEKSMATDLHGDAIQLEPEVHTETDKVIFLNFEGVAPSRYTNFFSAPEREDEIAVYKARSNATPVLKQALESFINYEKVVMEYLTGLGLTEKGETK